MKQVDLANVDKGKRVSVLVFNRRKGAHVNYVLGEPCR